METRCDWHLASEHVLHVLDSIQEQCIVGTVASHKLRSSKAKEVKGFPAYVEQVGQRYSLYMCYVVEISQKQKYHTQVSGSVKLSK